VSQGVVLLHCFAQRAAEHRVFLLDEDRAHVDAAVGHDAAAGADQLRRIVTAHHLARHALVVTVAAPARDFRPDPQRR
jgi:hypothetical protein